MFLMAKVFMASVVMANLFMKKSFMANVTEPFYVNHLWKAGCRLSLYYLYHWKLVITLYVDVNPLYSIYSVYSLSAQKTEVDDTTRCQLVVLNST